MKRSSCFYRDFPCEEKDKFFAVCFCRASNVERKANSLLPVFVGNAVGAERRRASAVGAKRRCASAVGAERRRASAVGAKRRCASAVGARGTAYPRKGACFRRYPGISTFCMV